MNTVRAAPVRVMPPATKSTQREAQCSFVEVAA